MSTAFAQSLLVTLGALAAVEAGYSHTARVRYSRPKSYSTPYTNLSNLNATLPSIDALSFHVFFGAQVAIRICGVVKIHASISTNTSTLLVLPEKTEERNS